MLAVYNTMGTLLNHVLHSHTVLSRDKNTVIAYLLMKLSVDRNGVIKPMVNNGRLNVLVVRFPCLTHLYIPFEVCTSHYSQCIIYPTRSP